MNLDTSRASKVRPNRRATRSFALASLLWLAAGALSPAPAQRVPAVGCEVSDFSMMLRLYLPLSPDGSGAPDARGMQGTLEIRHQRVPPARRKWSLDGRKPSQFWNVDGKLKMQILLGTINDRITLIIEAEQRDAAGQHTGNFRLETDRVKLKGRLACGIG